jgi:hypothetical protein
MIVRMTRRNKGTDDLDTESLSANLVRPEPYDQNANAVGPDPELAADEAPADQSASSVGVSEWEFGEVVPPPAGRGMLRQILEEVSALSNGAATDRAKLAEAVTATIAGFERQLAELRDALPAEADDREDDVQQAWVASQNEAMAAVVTELRSDLVHMSETISGSVMQLAGELRALRRALLGPD